MEIYNLVYMVKFVKWYRGSPEMVVPHQFFRYMYHHQNGTIVCAVYRVPTNEPSFRFAKINFNDVSLFEHVIYLVLSWHALHAVEVAQE